MKKVSNLLILRYHFPIQFKVIVSFLVCVIIRLKSPVTPLALTSRVSYGVISCFNDLVLLYWSFIVFYQGFPCSTSISGPIVYSNPSKWSTIYKESFQLIINLAIIILIGKTLMRCQVDHPFEVIIRDIFLISRIIIRISPQVTISSFVKDSESTSNPRGVCFSTL
jgi:hypothetical protein